MTGGWRSWFLRWLGGLCAPSGVTPPLPCYHATIAVVPLPVAATAVVGLPGASVAVVALPVATIASC